jgi:hypothetical protein
MLNELSHETYNLMINLGAVVAMMIGLGVMVSLILGAPVAAPVRRKR